MVSSFCFPPPTSVTNSSTFIPHLGFFNYDKESAGLLFCPLFVDFHSWHCTPCVPSFPPPYLKILIGCRSTASSHLPLIIQVFVSVLLCIRSFFRFSSRLVHHRFLSRVPCAKQQVLISHLFYT